MQEGGQPGGNSTAPGATPPGTLRAGGVDRWTNFELFAHGENFDVDTYLQAATLGFDRVWHTGEGYYKTSGVARSLGDGTPLGIYQQDEIAVEFLSTHRDALRELGEYPGVDSFILGLCYETELAANVTGFCLGPTPQLMRHCLDVGAVPVYYINLDRQQDIEAAITALFGGRCVVGTTDRRGPRPTKVSIRKRQV